MRKGTVIAAVVVAVAVVSGVYFGTRGSGDEEIREVVPPPIVEAVSPVRGDIEVSRGLMGSVAAADMVYVIPMAAGEITAVYVNVGDYVEEGQLLCEVDTKQVDSARLQMEAAQVQLADANANLERMQVLYQSGDIAAQSFEQVQSAAKAAQIQYDGAKLAYDYQVEFSHVTATIAGRIESSSMEVHSMATQQSPLCVIAGDSAKTISFSVTEAMLGNVHVGDEIRVEKNGSEYTGHITEVSTIVSMTTGLFDVKAEIEKADALVSGTAVKLYVTTQKAEDVLTLPVDAIYYNAGKPFVYTYEDGIVHEAPVETGLSDDESVEVLSGVDEADMVITTWSPELHEGAPARLKGDATAQLETGAPARLKGDATARQETGAPARLKGDATARLETGAPAHLKEGVL